MIFISKVIKRKARLDLILYFDNIQMLKMMDTKNDEYPKR